VLLLAVVVAVSACATDDDQEMVGGPFSSASGEAAQSQAQQAASAPAEADEEVVVRDASFQTEELTISVGTTVTWVNEDEMGHTVTHGEGGAPDPEALFDESLSAGQTVTYTFEEAGSYPVTCKVHPDMQMTVVVEEAS